MASAEDLESGSDQKYLDHPLANLSHKELVAAVTNLQKQEKLIVAENLVFKTFLEKDNVEIKTMIKKSQTIQCGSSHNRPELKKEKSIKIFSLVSTIDLSPREKDAPEVNISQKSHLVCTQIEETQLFLKTYVKKHHSIKNDLMVKIEELQIRYKELEQTTAKFEETKVDPDGWTLHKLVRFIDENSKRMQMLTDKFRLRYSSLRVQYQKLSVLFDQKQLIGEYLQEIDFEQLRIENVQLRKTIDTLSGLLLELKQISGAGSLKLAQNRTILLEMIERNKYIQREIKIVENMTARSDNELQKLQNDVENIRSQYTEAQRSNSEYKGPDVMDYIKIKQEQIEIKNQIKVWKRKTNVKNLEFAAFLVEMKRRGRQ